MTIAQATPARPAVLADLLPGTAVRNIALVAASALLVGASAKISVPIPGTPVPITGQTFAVLLSGAALGTGRSFAGMVVYLLAGLAGAPLFAPHAAISSYGYLLAYPIAAAAVGALAARGGDRTPLRSIATMAFGSLLIYAIGVPWLMATLHVGLGTGLAMGMVPFLIGDAVKVLIAAGVLPAAWAVVRRTHR